MTRPDPITTPRHELRAAKAQRNREAALSAFIAKKTEIDGMLARLASLSDDHFDAHPDEINWGHVGTLEHYTSLLKRITDSAFGEGEHAEQRIVLRVPPAQWRARPRRRARIPCAWPTETTMTRLSDTQLQILSAAVQRDDCNLLPLPGSLRDGAATKVVGALLSRGLIDETATDSQTRADAALNRIWRNDEGGRALQIHITHAGPVAIGIEPGDASEGGDTAPPGATDAPKDDAATEAASDATPVPKARKPREVTKQAQLITMLRASDGATIEEIMVATGWQSHTVRGAMAGAQWRWHVSDVRNLLAKVG